MNVIVGITRPPPGWCFMFSVEPTLGRTFFRSGRGAAASGAGERFFREPGDLGLERITATFFVSFPTGVLPPRDLLAGDLGVPGLLWPLASGVLGESNRRGQYKL